MYFYYTTLSAAPLGYDTLMLVNSLRELSLSLIKVLQPNEGA